MSPATLGPECKWTSRKNWGMESQVQVTLSVFLEAPRSHSFLFHHVYFFLKFCTQFLCVCMCVEEGCPPHKAILWAPLGSRQLHSILKLSTQTQEQMPQAERSVPQDCRPHQMPVAHPGHYLCFWPTGYAAEIPTAPSSVLINLLELLLELRKSICSQDYWLTTKDIKGY